MSPPSYFYSKNFESSFDAHNIRDKTTYDIKQNSNKIGYKHDSGYIIICLMHTR
jgi:hypothetical protein